MRAGGLAWLPGRPAGLYIVQGEYGTGFTRLVGAPAWLRVAPDAGSVATGGAMVLGVTFDSSLLLGGDYGATIEIRSNDPLTPLVEVPADLIVVGVPDIVLSGPEQLLESAIDYTTYGALTQHAFPIVVAPASDGSIELVAEGEFGYYYDRATASAEGLPLGSVGATGSYCAPATGLFPVGAADLLALAADGVVRVDVQNSDYVDPYCAVNRHTVRLRYRGAADRLDFGALFVGLSKTLEVEVRNTGTGWLEVSSIASDRPEFVPAVTSLSLAPRASATLAVTFTPGAVQSFDGTLTLESTDPDEAVTTVALSGIGLVPPDIQVTPSELSESLYSDQVATHTLTIENTGGADLVFRADALPRPGFRSGAAGAAPGAAEDETPGPLHPSETAGQPVRPLERADGITPSGLPLRDGFEDGDFVGWQVVPFTGNTSEVTDTTASPGGRYSFHHRTVTEWEHMSGVYQDLGPVQPRYISFWVRSGSTSTSDGYFVLRDSHGDEVIWFYATGGGMFYVNADVGGDESVPYVAQVWYHIEFRNVDFASKRFDYFVNGQLVRSGIPLRNADSTTDVARLDLYNWSPGSEAWWDEIVIAAEEPPPWLRVEPQIAVVPAGERLDLAVTFDATGLFGGDYAADLEVASNDPDEPRVLVPIQLHVTGLPRIEVRGSRIDAESTVPYYQSGAATGHRFPVPDVAVTDAELELVAEGDYGWPSELATASAEGHPLGSVGGTGTDCYPASGRFAIDEATLTELAADGQVDVSVMNSYSVDSFCAVNQHTVRIAFFGPSDRLDFGPVFLGTSRELQLELVNSGTETLVISSIASDQSEVVPLVTALEIPPRSLALVPVVYSPAAEGPLQGTLRITSNDPVRPELTLPLEGVGLIPPEISTRPDALFERLLPGEFTTLQLAVDNGGGSDLRFDVAIVQNSARAGLPPAPEGTPDRCDTRPAGFVQRATPPRTMDGAKVLLVEDIPPWDVSASAQIMDLDGIPYDLIPSSAFAATDLSNYLVVILSSDQPNDFYVNLSGLGQKLDEFVSRGGVLEFHAADGGWQYGDSSLVPVPGGLTAVSGLATMNFLLDETHPIVAGVPSPIYLAGVSLAYFSAIPADATLLAEDEYRRPTLVVYSHGAGLVVASGQSLEYLYSYNNSGGLLLVNMIPFSYGAARRWITVDPLSGTVPAEASLDLAVTFDARQITPNDYTADLVLESNDPTTPRLTVPVHLAVVRLIAQGGPDQVVECDGGGGASVTLDGSSSRHVDGRDAIALYQWHEGDTLLGEGERLAVNLPVGAHAITLRITDTQADTSADELFVTVADLTPPTGRITAPSDGQCFGRAALPVIVTDDYTDSCTGEVTRSYSLPQGAVYSEHGDWTVGLVASDASGNAAAEDTVLFTIDTVPPTVDILVLPSRWTFPRFIPFAAFFTSGDDDRATGSVVHETIAVDGCVVYDGLSFGDGDGVLLDEVLPAAEDEMCRLVRLCGRRRWSNPVVTVTATDCGGNSTTDTMIKPGNYYASPQRCP